MDSIDKREKCLQCRRERERFCRTSETAEEREERLIKRRLARACLARETAEQKERLKDRAWCDAEAFSNRDRCNTATKKREAAAEMPEEREARLHHNIIMRGRLATPGNSKCEAGY